MAVTKKALDAMDGCDKPFSSNSAIIQASKQKLADGQVSNSNGTGIQILSDDSGLASSETSKACTNVASFSINT